MPRSLSCSARDLLVQQNLPQVRFIAQRIRERLPRHVELDDLIQAGTLGLLDAAARFDARKNVQFSSYAQFRIRGAIMDSLRSLDLGSRDLRRRARQIEQARQRLALRFNRPASEEEVACELSVPLPMLREWLCSLHRVEFADAVSTEDGEQPDLLDRLPSSAPDPGEQLLHSEVKMHLAEAISELSPREQQVLALYYYEELNMKQVGAVLGVVESRVSQIHSAAVRRLRRIVGERPPVSPPPRAGLRVAAGARS